MRSLRKLIPVVSRGLFRPQNQMLQYDFKNEKLRLTHPVCVRISSMH